MKKQKDQTLELLQLNRLKAIEAEVKSKDEEIEDLREQVEIVQNEKEWSIFRNSDQFWSTLTLKWPDAMYSIEIKQKYRFNMNSASAQTVYFKSNCGSIEI